jgi:hypothetical protein
VAPLLAPCSSSSAALAPTDLRAIYLFAGAVDDSKSDLVAALEAEGFEVTAIDILRPGPDMDLLDDSVWEIWKGKLLAGYFDLAIVSPPCGTYSPARRLQPGPPILRFEDSTMVEGLNPWNRKQVKLADILSSRACEAFEIQMGNGGAAVFEQPEPRLGEPSLFHSERALGWWYNDRVRSWKGDQCPYGAASTKPTELKTVGIELPDFNENRCAHTRVWQSWTSNGRAASGYKAHIPLRGKDENGNWRTAPSSRYPYELCKYIAEQCFLAIYLRRSSL